MRIRAATVDDAAAIADIYAGYVTGTAVSFRAPAPPLPLSLTRPAGV